MTLSVAPRLAPAPRLIMGARAPRLRSVETDPLLAADLARVRREAGVYQTAAVWDQDLTVHNAHLLRARCCNGGC